MMKTSRFLTIVFIFGVILTGRTQEKADMYGKNKDGEKVKVLKSKDADGNEKVKATKKRIPLEM